ncbi:MAG: NAD(P)H-dependent oxidoreductase subunit E [bacterium]
MIDFAKIDEILSSYKGPSDLIPILQKTQEEYGHLSIPALQRIEEKTGIRGAEIFGVATFYAQFRFKPQGKNPIKVCHGTACHVSGAERIEEALRQELAVKGDEPTEDGLFSLEKIACLGCCALAPVIMVNKKCYGKLEQGGIKRVLSEYSK